MSDASDPQYSAETRIFARIFQRHRACTAASKEPKLLPVESGSAANWPQEGSARLRLPPRDYGEFGNKFSGLEE